jgi:hypothetical protein
MAAYGFGQGGDDLPKLGGSRRRKGNPFQHACS